MELEITWYKNGHVEINGYGLDFKKDGETQNMEIETDEL